MKQPENKYLLLNRDDRVYTTYENIPSYLHSQLIPYAKCFTDIDDNGVIIDQQLEMSELSIYYHLIHLKEGVALTTVAPDKYLLPAAVSGFANNNTPVSLKMLLSKKEGDALNLSPGSGTVITEKEFIMNFHVNLNLYYLKSLTEEFPAFGIIEQLGVEEAKNPSNKLPFRLNEVSYQVMNRILHCKLIGKAADIFFRRSAIDFYTTYLYYLSATPPVMLKESHRQQLREIAAYIIQYPAEAGCIEHLCDKFGVVREFLEKPFEQEYLISVPDLIQQEIMAIAFKLITETNHTLTYISTLTKHSSWEELTLAFEQYYKCNIADLRKAQ
jgi:AraC-like DNA-binding protein